MADCSPSANSSETVSSGVRSLSDDPDSEDEGYDVDAGGLAVGTEEPGGERIVEMEFTRERGWSLYPAPRLSGVWGCRRKPSRCGNGAENVRVKAGG